MSTRSVPPAFRLHALCVLVFAAGLAVSAFLAAASKASIPTRPSGINEYPLTVVAFTTEPSRPKSGHLFSAAIGILDEDVGEPLDSGDTHCRGRIGGRRVHLVRRQFIENSGIAICVWKIPAQTGGKRFYGRIMVTASVGQVTKKFSRVIKP